MTHLNETGRRILELLRANPCRTQQELAGELDIARETVRSQLEALRKDGLLRCKGYIVTGQGDRRVTRFVLIVARPEAIDEHSVEVELRKMPLILSFHLVTGTYDYFVLIDDHGKESEFTTLIGRIRRLAGVSNVLTVDVLPFAEALPDSTS